MSGSVSFDNLIPILDNYQLCHLRDLCTRELHKRDQETGNAVAVCNTETCTCRFLLPFGLTTTDVAEEDIQLDGESLVIYQLDRNASWQDTRTKIINCIRPLKAERITVNEGSGHAFLKFTTHRKAAAAQHALRVKGSYKVNFSCQKETMERFRMIRDEANETSSEVEE